MRVLITGGATRNKVDAIRHLSAHATGSTAVELTKLLVVPNLHKRVTRDSLVCVDFLGSAEACLRLKLASVEFGEDLALEEEFTSTRDLLSRMERLVPRMDVVVHSAAVGDYEWDTTDAKIPSGQPEVTIKGRPAPKILDLVRGWNPTCFLVSFKAAGPGTSDDELATIARRQLLRTGSDLVIANVIGSQERVLLVEEHCTYAYAQREQALQALVGRIHKARRASTGIPVEAPV